MTNEYGKSDRPVIPVKSPNNAGEPAAEGMEGRGLTKGNLPQQNASRTPSRSDAPSALERVRQAASKDKKMQFTALLHHIYAPEMLRTAYLGLKKEAAPGVDGETWQHMRLVSMSRSTRSPTAKDDDGSAGASEVASPLPPLAPTSGTAAGRRWAGAAAARATLTATTPTASVNSPTASVPGSKLDDDRALKLVQTGHTEAKLRPAGRTQPDSDSTAVKTRQSD